MTSREVSFLFQSVSDTIVLVQTDTSQGSLILSYLFCIFVSWLHQYFEKGTTISYVDDFSIIVVGLFYIVNLAYLKKLVEDIFSNAAAIDLPFGIPMTHLIHQHITKQKDSDATLLVNIRGNTFQPKNKIRQLGYWFTTNLQPIYHFEVMLQKAKVVFVQIGIQLVQARVLHPSMVGQQQSVLYFLSLYIEPSAGLPCRSQSTRYSSFGTILPDISLAASILCLWAISHGKYYFLQLRSFINSIRENMHSESAWLIYLSTQLLATWTHFSPPSTNISINPSRIFHKIR